MDRQETLSNLESMVSDYLKSRGFDLVDFIYRYEGQDIILRILVDRHEGGINLSDCANINRQITKILDDSVILAQNYVLEVSSPGLDRPLVKKSDFLRCLNKKAKFFLNEPVNGKIEIDGLIKNVKEDSVEVDTGDIIIDIALVKIIRAKQILTDN